MKKIFIIAIVIIMAVNFYCNVTYKGDQITPYYKFKDRIGMYRAQNEAYVKR